MPQCFENKELTKRKIFDVIPQLDMKEDPDPQVSQIRIFDPHHR
jgi:hypothetical protein